MATPGRNDPCPCGSGRKFKRCCGRDGPAADPVDVAARLHDLDGRVVIRILRFGQAHFPDEFQAALDGSPDPAMEREGYAQIVTPYVAYVAPFGDRRLLDLFLERQGDRLDPRERGWLEDNRRAWLSVWETRAGAFNVGVSLSGTIDTDTIQNPVAGGSTGAGGTVSTVAITTGLWPLMRLLLGSMNNGTRVTFSVYLVPQVS